LVVNLAVFLDFDDVKTFAPELLRRVLEEAQRLGARRATLEEARHATGFAAGGTPPFGYTAPVRVFADAQEVRLCRPCWKDWDARQKARAA